MNAERLQAVQRLFIQNTSVLRGFILGLLPDLERADDLLQDVFLTLSEKAEDFQPGSDFLAWARAVARIKVLQQFDRDTKGPKPLSPEAVEALVEAAPPLDESWAARRKALEACLEQLAPTAKKIVGLRYDAELLPPQIALKVSWTAGAVNVALARVRKFLRECTQDRLKLREA